MPTSPAPDGERIAALESQMADVREDVKAIREGQDELKELIARASGGLKVILWIGGMAAGITGLVRSVWPHGGTH